MLGYAILLEGWRRSILRSSLKEFRQRIHYPSGGPKSASFNLATSTICLIVELDPAEGLRAETGVDGLPRHAGLRRSIPAALAELYVP